jgi:hypothetical protein
MAPRQDVPRAAGIAEALAARSNHRVKVDVRSPMWMHWPQLTASGGDRPGEYQRHYE